MAGGNFDNEIRGAMSQKQPDPNSRAPGSGSGAGKRPPPMAARAHDADAKASPPQSPHQFKQPQQQAQGQQGLTQAADQFQAHMAPHNNAQPASSGLAQAHAQIVNALAQRDMLSGRGG